MHRLQFLSVLLLTAPAFGADSAPPSPYGGMLQMIGSLLLVVGILGGVAWFLRRYARPATLSPGLLRVITTQSLGPRERLVVVEAGESWLVLGVTGQSITPLHSMPRQETAPVEEAAARFDFSRILSHALHPHAKN